MKIAIVAGGTGGHIYPGIAIAEAILAREPQADILFFGSQEGLENDLVRRAGFKIRLIKARALLRKFSYQAISAPFVSFIGYFQALRALQRFRPKKLVSTGGYASLPVVAAGRTLGIPVVIHEQNVLPGVSNRLCFRLANTILLSFDRSLNYHPGRVVGNPVRREILEADRAAARKKLGLPADKKVVLVMGGSQGARRINETVIAALTEMSGMAWEIVHSIGRRDFRRLDAPGYSFYHPFEYLHNVAEALAAADLVVSRAGATALAEFTARGLPMILVPFPFSAEGHQDLNAQLAGEAGAAVVVSNHEFTKDRFISLLAGIGPKLKEMSACSGKLGRPDAADKIAALVLSKQ